jgi:hypothetical protein
MGTKMGKLSSWKSTQLLVDDVKASIAKVCKEKGCEPPSSLVIGALVSFLLIFFVLRHRVAVLVFFLSRIVNFSPLTFN